LAVFWNISRKIPGVCCYFGGFVEHLPGDFPAFVATSADFWNILRSFFSGICCCFGGFVEHLRENFRRLLLFWWFCGTFAGKFPAFVAALANLWNICVCASA